MQRPVKLLFGSPVFLAVMTVLFAACAGSLLSSGPLDLPSLLMLLSAIAAAMACGAAAALRWYRSYSRAALPGSVDAGDTTVEIELGKGLPLLIPATSPLKTFGAFIGAFAGAAASLMALAAAGAYWSSTAAGPMEPLAATPPVAEHPAPGIQQAVLRVPADESASLNSMSPALAEPAAPQDTPTAIRAVVRRAAVNPSVARRECLAQIESAHLFRGLARNAETAGAYTRTTNPTIKQFIKNNRVDPRTLEHIAMRMWERRDAPDREPQWWSTQFARCEEARSAGASYVVRG